MMRRVALIGVLVASGCVTALQQQSTVCPEYRNIRCVTAPECSMAQQRGCQVCQCRPPSGNPVPPDLRR